MGCVCPGVYCATGLYGLCFSWCLLCHRSIQVVFLLVFTVPQVYMGCVCPGVYCATGMGCVCPGVYAIGLYGLCLSWCLLCHRSIRVVFVLVFTVPQVYTGCVSIRVVFVLVFTVPQVYTGCVSPGVYCATGL